MPKKPTKPQKAELLELLKLSEIVFQAREKYTIAALAYIHKHKPALADYHIEDRDGDGLRACLLDVKKDDKGVIRATIDVECDHVGWSEDSAENALEYGVLRNIIDKEAERCGVELPEA